MHRSKRIKVTDVNPFLICVLCGGYYIDATTIIECLHSFCRSCIVKYLEKNKYCPICDVQIHKSHPLQNIRNDKTLQTIVYKLVPSLFQDEMHRRREFYKEMSEEELPKEPEARGLISEQTSVILPDEPISLCLEYSDPNVKNAQAVGKRYLHCPAAVTICHLYKLLKGKFSLTQDNSVQVYFKDDLLPKTLTLMDLAYTYQWRRKGPIHLTYRILETKKKRPKEELKEVELRISENGVMSVRGVEGEVQNAVNNLVKNSELEVVAVEPDQLEANKQRITAAKGEALNRIVSRLSPNERLIGNTSVSIRPVPNTTPVSRPPPPPAPPPTPPQSSSYVLSLFKQGPPHNPIVVGNVTVSKETPAPPKERDMIPRVSVSLTKEVKPKQFKYKTLKYPSKTWNPSINKSTVLAMKQQSLTSHSKPAKFFKARNNSPRFLGNPADGVKPIYSIGESVVVRSSRPPPFTPGSPKRLPMYGVLPRLPTPAHAGNFPTYPSLFSVFPPPDLLRSVFHPMMMPPLGRPPSKPIEKKQPFLALPEPPPAGKSPHDRTVNNNIDFPQPPSQNFSDKPPLSNFSSPPNSNVKSSTVFT